MVKIKFAVVAAILLTALAVSAQAQQAAGVAIPDGKVVVINTTVFPSQIGELKQKYDQVDSQFKDRYQKLQGIADQLSKLENDIKAKQSVLTADKLREMQDQYESLKRQGQRDNEDLQKDAEKALDAATKPVRDKLYQALNNYASKNGIVMVINLAGAAQSGSLAFWDPKSDITDEFIADYNKANPVPGAAPATAAPATTKPAVTPAPKRP
ncbi:MAG: OmpH family outer membrane protein [Acidobacteria bacterium]|nr:OmpH family outer membrane protein [Acidobacteriota bacterium]